MIKEHDLAIIKAQITLQSEFIKLQDEMLILKDKLLKLTDELGQV